MKAKSIITAALIAFGAASASAQSIKLIFTDGNAMEIKTSELQSVEFVEAQNDTPGTDDGTGHEYVDLGLPSGTLWATMNVGATSPEGCGGYYAWGETKAWGEEDTSNTHNYGYNSNVSYSKILYGWNTYKWCNGSYDNQTKYNTNSSYGTVDNITTIELADDAAYVNWGSNWRMPTNAEWTELRNNCSWAWTTQNGVYGCKVTASNGNSIFLPASGCRFNNSLYDAAIYGCYWSSSLNTDEPYWAYFQYLDKSSVDLDCYDRCYGRSVRAVRR